MSIAIGTYLKFIDAAGIDTGNNFQNFFEEKFPSVPRKEKQKMVQSFFIYRHFFVFDFFAAAQGS